jgi:hypothetical protein
LNAGGNWVRKTAAQNAKHAVLLATGAVFPADATVSLGKPDERLAAKSVPRRFEIRVESNRRRVHAGTIRLADIRNPANF